jgi:hypothetical protein
MRVLLLLCVSTALLMSGCRKKSNPEFYKLEADQSILVARDGDDAWVSPEMDVVLRGLQAIPEDSVEGPRAAALAAKVATEQARVKAEQAPKPAAAPPPDPFAGRVAEPAPAPAPPAEGGATGEVDAGEITLPFPGMDEKAFVARFGSCFSAGKPVPLPDGKVASSYVIGSSAACQKQFGSATGVAMYLFTEKGLWGKATETTQIIDAGMITLPAPPAPPQPAPPPPILTTPGAPQPEGYEKAPIKDAP